MLQMRARPGGDVGKTLIIVLCWTGKADELL